MFLKVLYMLGYLVLSILLNDYFIFNEVKVISLLTVQVLA